MTELLRRSRRLEIYINNSSNQLVEEFQSRNVHVVHSHRAMRACLCLWLVRLFVSAVDIFSFSRTFPFHEWFDSLFSASECKHSERDQMKIKSDQRSPDRDWGSGLRPHILHWLAIFKRDGIPLMQSRVTAIPGSQAGQYRVKCIARAPSPSRVSPVSIGCFICVIFFWANKWVRRERETGGNVRGPRNNIQSSGSWC